MKVHGAFHCGAIAYEAEIDPEQVILCHCSDCQSLSGAPYRSVVFTLPGAFELLKGELKTYVKTADSGNKRAQTFCPDCGSPIYASSLGDGPKVYGLRVGAIAERDRLKPKAQYYLHSAQDWVQDLSGLEKIGGDS
jgi:hypothetical protein